MAMFTSNILKHNRQPGVSPPKKEGRTSTYLCVTCSKNAETDCVECDWCGKWVHRECAELFEEELKVLYSINTNVKSSVRYAILKLKSPFNSSMMCLRNKI